MNRDELVRRACQGDQVARDAIGKWLSLELTKFLRRKGLTAADAEDVLQEAMVDLWAKADREHPRDAADFLDRVRGYAGMATLEAKGELKRDFKFARRLEESMPEPEPVRLQHSEIREQEQLELIRQWMPRLPTIYRNALRVWLDEDDVAAMAERAGIKAGAMWVRISRAKKMVKKLIEDARLTPSHLR